MEPGRNPVDLGGGDLLARLSAWAAGARADEAAAARSRERWLRRAAEEGATFAGVLLDLAEREAIVVVTGRGGRRHRGVLETVGADFAVLRLGAGTAVLLPFSGMAAVRGEGGAPPPTGDREVTAQATFVEALALLAEDRPRVVVVTHADADGAGAGVVGELRAVGEDVVHVRLDGADRAPAYVPVAGIAEVRLA